MSGKSGNNKEPYVMAFLPSAKKILSKKHGSTEKIQVHFCAFVTQWQIQIPERN